MYMTARFTSDWVTSGSFGAGARLRKLALVFLALFLVAGLASGCASRSQQSAQGQVAALDPDDPWEATNRDILDFNLWVNDNLGRPVFNTYKAVVPPFGRDSIDNFVTNFNEPVNMINALLQWNGGRAAESLMRLLVNSTLGFGGFFDVAGQYGLAERPEDFGQTLAVWGVEPGYFLMVPLLGPSNFRDLGGEVADNFMNPISYFFPDPGNIVKSVVGAIDGQSRAQPQLDELRKSSVDLYAAIKSLYRQNRDAAIRNTDDAGAVKIPVFTE